ERLVRERPTAGGVIQIVLAILHKDPDWLFRRFADHRGIVMPAFSKRRTAGDIGKAAYPRENLAEFIRALPGNRPGADAAAADASNCATGGIPAKFVALFDFGKNLFEQKPSIAVRQRIVFEAAIRSAADYFRSGLNEDGNDDGYLAFCNQIIEYYRRVILRIL